MRIYLIRHGQTEWNASGRAQGHSDVELDETGKRQAEVLAQALCDANIQRVFSSDLKRCVATATPLVQMAGLQLEARPDLRERTFGELEGAHYTEIRCWFNAECRERNLKEHEIRPEGGESLRDVWHRLEKFHRLVNNIRESSVVFTHGGTCGLLLSRLMNGTVHTARSFRFENAGITELKKRQDGHWQLVRYCDTSHLSALSDVSDESATA
ncbi:histidine phosphatase family protein [Kamptonema cortianum]|nr:histidine phosphatase family protein [Geitlerinema splendidum]MDK3157688.1 histidine phosphatase family protein [Kamptonema cortianum]